MLARHDDLLMEVEDWNERNGAGRMVPWELLARCCGADVARRFDGSVSGADLIERLLSAQERLMRPRLEPRTASRSGYASRR